MSGGQRCPRCGVLVFGHIDEHEARCKANYFEATMPTFKMEADDGSPKTHGRCAMHDLDISVPGVATAWQQCPVSATHTVDGLRVCNRHLAIYVERHPDARARPLEYRGTVET